MPVFDTYLLFGTELGFGGSVDAASLLEFVDSGHDLILAADTSASDLIREIAVECGVDFDEVRVSLVILVLYHILYVSDAIRNDSSILFVVVYFR